MGRTAEQWNSYFASKANANSGTICNPTIIGGSGGGGGGGSGTGVGVQGGQSPSPLGDNNAALPAGHFAYYVNVVFTAARTKLLPSSATQGAGDIEIIDTRSGLTSVNSLTVCAAGSDTVNGGLAGSCAPAIAATGGALGLHNDGAGHWTTTYQTLLQASTAPTHQFATGLNSGGLAYSQPAFTDLSGTSGVVGQLGVPASWTAEQDFAAVRGAINNQGSATSYTLQASDCGKLIKFTSNSPITVTTLNSIQPVCSIAIEQLGTGQITISNGSGATQHSAHNYTKTFGQYSILGLTVESNSGGSSANYIISGDGA